MGSEVLDLLSKRHPDVEVRAVGRRSAPDVEGGGQWKMGGEVAPAVLRRPWDAVIHCAASTRWSMTRVEAAEANVEPVRSLQEVLSKQTHLVHLSTAYVEGIEETDPDRPRSGYGRFRNAYEWSKAESEALLSQVHRGPTTVVRPPLVIGRSTDGRISRFTGPYTLAQTLVSGLAAAVVGSPTGLAEVAPVDLVAEVCVSAALNPDPPERHVDVITAGDECMTLQELLVTTCDTLNTWRADRDLPLLEQPPLVSVEQWHRFFLPLAREYLSPAQAGAVELMGLYESYTNLTTPIIPTVPVHEPTELWRTSLRYWADTKPRWASRLQQSWQSRHLLQDGSRR